MELSTDNGYCKLLEQIGSTCTHGRMQAMRAVNRELLETYWQIGRHIVEFEQAGQLRAEYGKALIVQLARDLSLRHGKGFSRSNLIRIRQFYLLNPKGATLSHLLSWSHLVELLKIDDPLERGFYEQQCASERWSVRELVRQKESALFLRLAARQGRAARRIRHLPARQSTLRPALPALPAGPGRTAPRAGTDLAGGRAMNGRRMLEQSGFAWK